MELLVAVVSLVNLTGESIRRISENQDDPPIDKAIEGKAPSARPDPDPRLQT